MPMADIFGGDAFGAATLTDAINRRPKQWGRINQLGLFMPKGISTTSALVEYKDGIVNLIPSAPRGGGKHSVGVMGKRSLMSFHVPHFPHEDFITTTDLQNVRKFGSEYELASLGDLVNDKVESLGMKFDLTEEYHRAGALKGNVLDADGTVIYNYFTEFGIAQTSFAFPFSSLTTDLNAWIAQQVGDYYELNSDGEFIEGIHAFCSTGFFQSLITHPSVADAYRYYQQSQAVLTKDMRRGFEIGGVTFEKYLGRAPYLQQDGTTVQRLFVPTNEAIIFPLGTQTTFRNYDAPPDRLSHVNEPGMRRYIAPLLVDPEDRWVKISAELNSLPLTARPHLLTRGTAA